jgi:chromosome segregation ATPase
MNDAERDLTENEKIADEILQGINRWPTLVSALDVKDATITQLRAQLSASQKEAKLWELRVSESAACAENWEKWAHDYHAQLAESQTKVKNWEIEYTTAMAQGVQFIDSLRAQLAESQKETAAGASLLSKATDRINDLEASLRAANRSASLHCQDALDYRKDTATLAKVNADCNEIINLLRAQLATAEAERDAEIETRIECNRKLTSIFGILMSEQGA